MITKTIAEDDDSAAFLIVPSRGKDVVEGFLGKHRPDFWVSDRLAAQMGWAAKEHQVCLAHLIRDVQYAIDEGDSAFAPKPKELFERACRIGRRRSLLADAMLRSCASKLERRLDRLLRIAPSGRAGEKLQRMIKRYRQNLFVFVTNRELPPTNNGSEQALRPCVTFRKVTNCFRSEWGARLYADIRSVLETARRRAIDPLRAIRLTLSGEPLPAIGVRNYDEFNLWGNAMPRHLTKIMLLAGACMALALPAKAEINWSGYGELGGGIGTSALSDSGRGCATFGGTAGCWSNQTHISQVPTRLDGNFHLNALFDFGLRLQFDAEADRRFVGKSALFDPHEGVDRITTYGMGIHIDLRHDDFLVGALVSAGNVDASFMHNRVATYGFEGEWFLDRTTLFSQVTHSRSVQGPRGYGAFYWPQAWYLHVGARYFPLENLKLEVNAGKVLGQVTSDPTVGNSENGGDAGQWGAKVEYRFGFMPLGLSVDYQGSYATWKSSYRQSGVYPYPVPTNYSYDAHQTWRRNENLFMLRLHMYFGDESLLAGDHNGNGMNDYNPWYGEHSVAPAYAGDRYFVPIMPPL